MLCRVLARLGKDCLDPDRSWRQPCGDRPQLTKVALNLQTLTRIWVHVMFLISRIEGRRLIHIMELLPPFLQFYILEDRRSPCRSPIPLILSPSGVTGSNRNSPPSATCARLSDSPPPAVRQAGLPLQSRRRDRPRPLLVADLQGPGENRDTLDSSGRGGAHAGTDSPSTSVSAPWRRSWSTSASSSARRDLPRGRRVR